MLIKIFALCIILSTNSLAHADIERALELHSQGRLKDALPEFVKEAENGNVIAKYYLSQIYMSSMSRTPVNEANANKWEAAAYNEFLELAHNGDEEAQYYLGLMHGEGHRADSALIDLDQALYWFKLASINGHSEASLWLGMYYENAGQNISEAIKMYKLSVSQGNVFAAGSLGIIFKNGKSSGGVRDKEKSLQWFARTMEMWETQINPSYEMRRGASDLFMLIAKSYLDLNDVEKSLETYSKSAELGNSQSMTELAILYMQGAIVEINEDKAVNWLVRSYEKQQQDQLIDQIEYESEFGAPLDNNGFLYNENRRAISESIIDIVVSNNFKSVSDPITQNDLGNYYINQAEYHKDYYGNGLQNYHNALSWYLRAANQGLIKAYHNLGRMYDEGKGIGADYAEALKWYKLAAKEGYIPSQNNLGVMIANGRGTDQKLNIAYNWFKKAANANDYFAQVNLGMMFGKGLGVNRSTEEAGKWFRNVLSSRFSSENTIHKD